MALSGTREASVQTAQGSGIVAPGTPAPEFRLRREDGRSFTPLMEGKSIPWRDSFLYEFYEFPDADHCVRKNRGVRTTRRDVRVA